VDALISFMTKCGVKDGIAILERQKQIGSFSVEHFLLVYPSCLLSSI